MTHGSTDGVDNLHGGIDWLVYATGHVDGDAQEAGPGGGDGEARAVRRRVDGNGGDGVAITGTIQRLKDYVEALMRITTIIRPWESKSRECLLAAAKAIIDAEKKAIGTKESMR